MLIGFRSTGNCVEALTVTYLNDASAGVCGWEQLQYCECQHEKPSYGIFMAFSRHAFA